MVTLATMAGSAMRRISLSMLLIIVVRGLEGGELGDGLQYCYGLFHGGDVVDEY